MTLVLGLVAAVLLMGLVGLIVKSNNQDDALAFTSPQELSAGLALATPASTIPVRTVPSRATPTSTLASAPTRGSTPSDFYPGNLGIGTRLSYRGETSEIQGIISFEHNGETWRDYLASFDSGRWWRLGVEPDRNMRLIAFAPTTAEVQPGPDQIMHDGHLFAVSEAGPATYRTVGRTGHFETGKHWFFDYRNNTGQVLNFERFDSSPWVVSIGHVVHPSEVEVSNFSDES